MNSLKISTKLNFGFALVVAVFLLLAGVTAWQIGKVYEATERMHVSVELVKLAGTWQGDVRQNSARSLAVAYSEGNAVLDFFKESMSSTTRSTAETQKAFLEKVSDPESRKRADHVGELRKQFIALRDEVNQLKVSSDNRTVQAFVQSKLVPCTAQYIQATQDLVDGEVANGEAIKAEIKATFLALYQLGAVLTLLIMAMAAFISWRLSHDIASGLASASLAAQRIGEGDLSQAMAITNGDEVGRMLDSLQKMQVKLSNVVSAVRQGSESVANASTEIAQGNQDLSARTESQASALEQTASSMEELNAQVKHNADNALQASQLASNASLVAVRGGEVVGRVVETMKEINTSSRKISDIIGVIDGIAFQTNILALNAAVEAARAGEQGRGFAVVASEVRSLAGRSADAAKEIKSLINASVERVEQGTVLVDEAGVTMTEVVGAIRRVNDLVGEISSASSEQASGVAQVGEAVSQMDQVTQQNAALVEQMAAAASSLSSQAQDLVHVVSAFKLGDGVRPQLSHAIEVPSRSASRFSQPRVAVGVASAGAMGINLDNAIKAHADWRSNLRLAAQRHEQIDADRIGRDDCCELGKWLHGTGQSKCGAYPSFVALINGHKAFHQEAGKVAQAINQGRYEHAETMLGSNTGFSRASSEVTRLIVQLRSDSSGKSTPTTSVNPVAMNRLTRAPSVSSAALAPAGGDADWETF